MFVIAFSFVNINNLGEIASPYLILLPAVDSFFLGSSYILVLTIFTKAEYLELTSLKTFISTLSTTN